EGEPDISGTRELPGIGFSVSCDRELVAVGPEGEAHRVLGEELGPSLHPRVEVSEKLDELRGARSVLEVDGGDEDVGLTRALRRFGEQGDRFDDGAALEQPEEV